MHRVAQSRHKFGGSSAYYHRRYSAAVVVSYADRAYGKSSSSTARREGGVELEDLLRYGGARCVSSLAENRAWLHSMYLKLASVGDYDEVLMNLACRLFSCHGLLRMGAVALQAKLSDPPTESC